MKRSLSLIIISVLLVLNLACTDKGASAEKSTAVNARIVKTQAIEPVTMTEKLLLVGNIRAANIANVLSAEEGKISRLLVREGDKVDSNMVVAMISSMIREDIITAAQLQVESNREQLLKDPNNKFFMKAFEEAQEDYEFASKQYKEKAVISPMNGVVSKRWINPGDMVPAKFRMFEILDDTHLVIDVPVSELDIHKLNIGQEASIFADANNSKEYDGIITRIYPEINTRTRNGMVEIEFQGDITSLKPGMFVRVRFITRTLEDIIAIPVEAVIERPGRKSCFIVKEGVAEERMLETGLESGGKVEVLSGLSVGEQLVIEGQQQLRADMPVRVQKTTRPAGNTERSDS